MTILEIVLLITIGFFSGFINVMAAGGSMFVIPFLIFLGVSPSEANATNRLAILLHTTVAVTTFKQKKVLDFKTDRFFIIPTLLGAIIGAIFAVDINEDILETIIGALLILMFLIFLFNPSKLMKNTEHRIYNQHPIIRFLVLFLIGLYSGFIQMGVGFFILANLIFTSRMDLLKANAIKSLTVFLCTVVATGIFIYNDLIIWETGLILALGNMLGAYLATSLSVKIGTKYIRYFVLFALVAVATKMLFF